MGNLNGPAASSDVPNEGAPVIRRKLDMEVGRLARTRGRCVDG